MERRFTEEDRELAHWLDSGQYGYIDPLSQFEFDDDFEKEYQKTRTPWYGILARWRARVYSLWRMIRHYL